MLRPLTLAFAGCLLAGCPLGLAGETRRPLAAPAPALRDEPSLPHVNLLGRGSRLPIQGTIDHGLAWLLAHQSTDGSWSSDDLAAQCAGAHPACDAAGEEGRNVGASALALLALMAEGSSDMVGRHRQVVKAGSRWLVTRQDRTSGAFSRHDDQPAAALDHVLATLAMTRLFVLTGQHRFVKPAELGLRLILARQLPDGGWATDPLATRGEPVLTCWTLMTLQIARHAGLLENDLALTRARPFVAVQMDALLAIGADRALHLEQPVPRPDAVAAFAVTISSILLDPQLRADRAEARLRAATLVLQTLTEPALREQPGHAPLRHLAAQAWLQLGRVGDEGWQHFVHASLKQQRDDAGLLGSWDPGDDPWSRAWGRVGTTALFVHTLQVPQAYRRVLQSW